ncbi:hypothetical protein B0H67DRAFT_642515 [Lasiosphaeris hirsuta]|uniref:Uncharacterized protein n=1 Tax=Lasiosphaeris hirsuta TaxID=260670 RepID=A0AA40ANL7_9PEZI|nr:hypothetical protein B0H67DRAFT_642515 [Lasiosphaeris hirsuta]
MVQVATVSTKPAIREPWLAGLEKAAGPEFAGLWREFLNGEKTTLPHMSAKLDAKITEVSNRRLHRQNIDDRYGHTVRRTSQADDKRALDEKRIAQTREEIEDHRSEIESLQELELELQLSERADSQRALDEADAMVNVLHQDMAEIRFRLNLSPQRLVEHEQSFPPYQLQSEQHIEEEQGAKTEDEPPEPDSPIVSQQLDALAQIQPVPQPAPLPEFEPEVELEVINDPPDQPNLGDEEAGLLASMTGPVPPGLTIDIYPLVSLVDKSLMNSI